MQRTARITVVVACVALVPPAWPQGDAVGFDDDGFRRLGQCGFARALSGQPEKTIERYSSAAVRIATLSGQDGERALALFGEGSDREAERLRAYLQSTGRRCIAADGRRTVLPVDIRRNSACARSLEAWLSANEARLSLDSCVWYLQFSANH